MKSQEEMNYCKKHDQKYRTALPGCPICYGETILNDKDYRKAHGLDKDENISRVTYNKPEVIERVMIKREVIEREPLTIERVRL
jgi:hypothetical protein